MQEIKRQDAALGSMWERARGIARRFGQIGIMEPEDIAQNAMLRVLRKRDGKPVSSNWLYQAVRCAAVDASRVAERHIRPVWIERDEERMVAVCECANEHGDFHTYGTYVAKQPTVEIDVMPRLQQMLQQLSVPLRQVLVLHTEGYSYKEIAKMTKTNIGTVRSRLFYARRRAKELTADLI